jgi:hypothetical protein
VEDASAVWPVTVETDCLEEAISLFEKEVIIYELLTLGLGQVVQWVVGAVEVPLHVGQGLTDFLLNLLALIIGNTWTKWVVS